MTPCPSCVRSAESNCSPIREWFSYCRPGSPLPWDAISFGTCPSPICCVDTLRFELSREANDRGLAMTLATPLMKSACLEVRESPLGHSKFFQTYRHRACSVRVDAWLSLTELPFLASSSPLCEVVGLGLTDTDVDKATCHRAASNSRKVATVWSNMTKATYPSVANRQSVHDLSYPSHLLLARQLCVLHNCALTPSERSGSTSVLLETFTIGRSEGAHHRNMSRATFTQFGVTERRVRLHLGTSQIGRQRFTFTSREPNARKGH